MSDWTSGYVADIDYTYGYYTELNPLRIKLAFLRNSLVFPKVGTACELGFGQGMSTNLHAAASMVSWSGTDFNPAQAGFAQELAEISGANAQLFDQAFDQFCHRDDLPEFDYIGLHGIWSWINDENRSVIVDFIRRKLKVGGVLYISYNTQPGWAAMVPMRDLMTEHAEVMGAEGAGIVNRIDSALNFVDQLLAANPSYARANPQIAERVARIKTQDRHYVAHEYFNRDWQPMAFAKMAEWLEPAKLQFACSADYLGGIDSVNLTQEQQQLLQSIPDLMFRQTVRDFCVNQQFRKDYWVKGARKLNAAEQVEQLRELRFILTIPRNNVSLKTNGSIGEITLNESIYAPVLDILADHKARTLGELEQQLSDKGITLFQLAEVAMILSHSGAISFVQDEAVINKVHKRTKPLNSHIMSKARVSQEIAYLASPVTGGGINVPRFQQLFLLAMDSGHKKPSEMAQFVWKFLTVQNQRLVKDGKAIETVEDNVAELMRQATEFCELNLPILKALKVA